MVFRVLSGLLLVGFILVGNVVAYAAVELSRQGKTPQLLEDVYHHEGVPYFAIDDVLPALGMSGYWDSIAHIYKVKTPLGRGTFFPGCQYFKVAGKFYPIQHSPSFIDGRLRVSEDFVLEQLADVLQIPIYYRNLNPVDDSSAAEQGVFDKLFTFLLQKKKTAEVSLRAVAIDIGHGGEDTGTIALSGVKEKDVVLAVGKKLEKKIKMQLGVPVYLSRDADYALTRKQHLACAHHDNVDAFLLLHAQSTFSTTPHGVHLYVRPAQDEFVSEYSAGASSMMLALRLSAALRDAGFTVVEVAQAPLLPLGRGDLPTVLVELGYLSSEDDMVLLTGSAGQQRLADALYTGLREFSRGTN